LNRRCQPWEKIVLLVAFIATANFLRRLKYYIKIESSDSDAPNSKHIKIGSSDLDAPDPKHITIEDSNSGASLGDCRAGDASSNSTSVVGENPYEPPNNF
jgi:hypothetical protein